MIKKSMGSLLFLIILANMINISYAEKFDFDYSEIFENHKLVRLIIDVETGAILKVNEAAVIYYGYDYDEFLNMKITEINTLSPEETQSEWEAATKEERNYFNFRHRLASGEIRDVEVHSYPFVHQDESYLYSIIIDKTDAVAATKELERNRLIMTYLVFLILFFGIGWLIYFAKSKEKYRSMSHNDQLTKVYSRHYLAEWQSFISNHKPDMSKAFSVVMLDVDRFKQINDYFGHLIGDQVLIEVANVLKHSVRDNDLVIRYGGDEFILILENSTESRSQIIMERIKKELLNMKKFEFSIEISYGVAEMKSNPSIFEAIGLADKKMYEMKKMRK